MLLSSQADSKCGELIIKNKFKVRNKFIKIPKIWIFEKKNVVNEKKLIWP